MVRKSSTSSLTPYRMPGPTPTKSRCFFEFIELRLIMVIELFKIVLINSVVEPKLFVPAPTFKKLWLQSRL